MIFTSHIVSSHVFHILFHAALKLLMFRPRFRGIDNGNDHRDPLTPAVGRTLLDDAIDLEALSRDIQGDLEGPGVWGVP